VALETRELVAVQRPREARDQRRASIPCTPLASSWVSNRTRHCWPTGSTVKGVWSANGRRLLYGLHGRSLGARDRGQINTLPTEVANPIPGDVNRTNSAYDPDPVTRWWRIQLQTARVLDVYRSAFAGKSSPVNFYWGSFDLNHTRFSGRPAPRPHGPLFYQLAEDQENFACGFWPGNANMAGLTPGDAAFYAYIYPEPSGFREAAASLASWDRDALEARPPTRLHRRRTSC